MAVTQSSGLLQVLDPAKFEIFLDSAINRVDIDSFFWCKMRPADTRTIEKASINAPGAYSAKSESSAEYNWSAIDQGNSKTYTLAESAIAFQVSSYAYHFMNKVALAEFVAQIGAAATRKLNADAYGVLAGGFSDSGPDGVSLFDASHPLTDGSTTSNTSSNALGEANLQASLTTMRREVTPDGVLTATVPTHLIVPPDLEFTAKELVQSALSGTDNQINVLSQKGLTVLVSPDLTDTNDYFLVDAMNFRCFQFLAKGPSPVTYVDPDSDNYRIKDSLISTQGYDSWRGAFGASVA